jgi:hypothetical protein
MSEILLGPLRRRDRNFDGFADVPPASKAPAIRETFALVRLYRLDAALIRALQEEAGAVLLFDERKVAAIRTQLRKTLDESKWAAMASASRSVTMTSPGQRQQLPQRWQR